MPEPLVVVVTGAKGGLGAAMLDRIAAAGQSSALELVPVMRATADAQPLPPGAIACDITRDDEVDALVKALNKRYGKVDVLINCAGVDMSRAGRADKLGAGNATRLNVETNFRGTVRVCESLAPLLAASKAPRVVNVCSSAGVPDCLPMQHQTCLKATTLDLRQLDSIAAELVSTVNALEQAKTASFALLLRAHAWAAKTPSTNLWYALQAAGTLFAARGTRRKLAKSIALKSYRASKVLQLAYTRVFAHALVRKHGASERARVTACCPGSVATGMSLNKGDLTPSQGVETPFWLALADAREIDGMDKRGFYKAKTCIWDLHLSSWHGGGGALRRGGTLREFLLLMVIVICSLLAAMIWRFGTTQ